MSKNLTDSHIIGRIFLLKRTKNLDIQDILKAINYRNILGPKLAQQLIALLLYI